VGVGRSVFEIVLGCPSVIPDNQGEKIKQKKKKPQKRRYGIFAEKEQHQK
jgi:hypothetical protein